MDFQGFTNTFAVPCAVLSVQKLSDGQCGEIRIVKANDLYKERMGVVRYHDSMLYSELVPKDRKFEDFCYRSAVLKQKLHSYVETKGLNSWTDSTYLPLNCEENDLAYCAFFFEFTREAEPERMAVIPMETATEIIENGITLQSAADFKSGVTTVIEKIQAKTKAFCCCILIPAHKTKTYSVLCEKFSDDIYRLSDYKDNLTYEVVASWEKTIGLSNGVIVNGEEDMKSLEARNPLWVKTLRAAQVKSLILYPLLHKRKHIGYFFITNFDTENIVKIKELIELSSFFLSSELSNHLVRERLENLNTIDLLTGAKNRNAMNNMVDSFVKGEQNILAPFGIIFATVNNLNKINEENGHDYGDILLKKAVVFLEEFFPSTDIYRTSGDQFLIILQGCQQKEFEAKISLLKQKTDGNQEISLSIGSYWNEEGKKIRRAMHLATINQKSENRA